MAKNRNSKTQVKVGAITSNSSCLMDSRFILLPLLKPGSFGGHFLFQEEEETLGRNLFPQLWSFPSWGIVLPLMSIQFMYVFVRVRSLFHECLCVWLLSLDYEWTLAAQIYFGGLLLLLLAWLPLRLLSIVQFSCLFVYRMACIVPWFKVWSLEPDCLGSHPSSAKCCSVTLNKLPCISFFLSKNGNNDRSSLLGPSWELKKLTHFIFAFIIITTFHPQIACVPPLFPSLEPTIGLFFLLCIIKSPL